MELPVGEFRKRRGLAHGEMKIMVPIVIWGAGGHAKTVTEILELDGGWVIAGYLDSVNPDRWRTTFEGYPVLGGLEALAELRQRGVRHIALAIGDNRARRIAGETAQAVGLELVTAIHPHACVSAKAVLGRGVVCAAGSVVARASVVCEGVIVNTGAIVDHDCTLGSYSHIAPGAKLAGNVEVGAGAWIGLGAAVLEKLRIGEMTMVGAGAVVTKNLPGGVVAFGVPAKIRCVT
jgi:sugar O-acyltransferase (sialic acid O-acetyltransferase NeuD family)